MIESVGTIVINTSPDEVFGFLAHREHFPQWATGGSGVRVVILSEGSFGDGTLIGHMQVVSRVSHLHVNHGFETDTIRIHLPSRWLVKHMPDRFQFEPVGQGTQVTLTEHIEPTPLLKPFEHVVAKRTHQHTQALLEQLKHCSNTSKGKHQTRSSLRNTAWLLKEMESGEEREPVGRRAKRNQCGETDLHQPLDRLMISRF